MAVRRLALVLLLVVLVGVVSAQNYEFTNQSDDIIVTIYGATGNVSSTGWFEGLFSWVVDTGVSSSSYLSFNGSDLSFNDSFLNDTIDDRLGGITGDNSSWNESYADTLYQPLGIAYNETYENHIQDNSSWNESYASTLFYGADADAVFTSLNVTAVFRVGSTTLYADDTGALNVSGTTHFDGSWQEGGVTITGGSVFAQTLYVYNVTSLAVDSLRVNGTIIPGGNESTDFNNTFDLGDTDVRWRDAYIAGDVYINERDTYQWLYNQTADANTYTDSVVTNNISAINEGLWETDGSYIYNDTTSGVGIGTGSPNAALEVNLSGAELRLADGGANTQTNISFYRNGFLYGNLGTYRTHLTANALAGRNLELLAGGSGIVVESGGEVGIGTPVPGALLVLNGSDDENGGIVFMDDDDSEERLAIYTSGSASAQAKIIQSGGYFTFADANGNNFVAFDEANQRVGIGTITPAVRLDSVVTSNGTIAIRGDSTASLGDTRLYFDGSGNGVFYALNTSGNSTLYLSSGGVSYLNGGNVGIGTSSPQELLHLSYAGAADDVHGLRIEDFRPHINLLDRSSSADDFQIKVDSDNFYINRDADGTTFADNYLTILGSSGNFGIGTSSPGEELQVSGQINATEVCLDSGVCLSSVSGGGELWATNGTNLYNDTTLAVGIGTASPDGTLHVQVGDASLTPHANADDFVLENTGAYSGMSILTDDDQRSLIYWGSPSDTVGAYAQWVYDENLMQFGTATPNANLSLRSGNAVEAIRIDGDGNVGIGTSTPEEELVVAGGAGTYVRVDTPGVNGDAGFQIYRNGARTWNFQNDYTGAGSTDTLLLVDTGGDANIAFTQAGNVGIGTSAPSTTLDINPPTGEGIQINTTANGQTYIDLEETGSHGVRFDLDGSGNVFTIQRELSGSFTDMLEIPYAGTDAGNLTFPSGIIKFGTNTMINTSKGWMAIGDTSPFSSTDRELTVVGTVRVGGEDYYGTEIAGTSEGDPKISFYDWYNRYARIYFDSSEEDLVLTATSTVGDSHILLMPEDNVGIGTPVPTAKLQINGSSTDGALYINGDTPGIDGIVFVKSDSYINSFVTNGFGLRQSSSTDVGNLDYAYTGTINYNTRDITSDRDLTITTAAGAIEVARFHGGSDQSNEGDIGFDTDTLYVDSSANRVGIGTDTPTFKTDIYESGTGTRQGLNVTAITSTINVPATGIDVFARIAEDDTVYGLKSNAFSLDSASFAYGVYSNGSAKNGQNGYGGYFLGESVGGTNAYGVYAVGEGASNNYGIYAKGDDYGVYGTSSGTTARGVFGQETQSAYDAYGILGYRSGVSYGGYFSSSDPSGYASYSAGRLGTSSDLVATSNSPSSCAWEDNPNGGENICDSGKFLAGVDTVTGYGIDRIYCCEL